MLILCFGASGRLEPAGCFGLVDGPERSWRFNSLWGGKMTYMPVWTEFQRVLYI